MPTYDYRCGECAAVFEASHGVADPAPTCRRCGGQCSRVLLTAPAVHGSMARGRDQAARSLPECGRGCRCCP